MPLVAQVGYTAYTRGNVTVEWKIRDFLSLSDNVDDFYQSPVISFADTRWRLRLYTNGETGYKSSNWLGLYLVKGDSGPTKTVKFTLGIKSSFGVIKRAEAEYKFQAVNGGWGCSKFWSRSHLRKRKSTLLPNKVLTITCNLRDNAVNADKGEKILQKSLLSMLESGEDSDVVIKVQGKAFPVHRGILRARSPVFRSMFSHEMVEKQSGVVTIEDLDPELFNDFLVHIYSGSCEQISAKNVYGLYIAADKYDMNELKEECARFMKLCLTVSCFCDVVTLAMNHDDKELIECATTFFCSNSLDIAKTVKWQTFIEENPTVGNELFIKALSK